MTMNDVIKKIIHNRYDFCCLCLRSLANEKFFSIVDEVTLDHNHTRDMIQILSYVVRDTILKNIVNTFGFICHNCTEAAIFSYKFAQKCQNNAFQLWDIVKCLNKHLEKYCDTTGTIPLYISLNITKFDVELCEDNTSLNDSFVDTQDISANVSNNSIHNQTDESLTYSLIQAPQEDNNNLEEKPLNKKIVKPNHVNKNEDIRDKTDLSMFKCKLCNNVYSRGPNLKKHYLSVHAPKVHKCLICLESFGSKFHLKEHKKQQHTEIIIVCCIECGKTFKNVCALQNHEKRHKSRMVCQHCGKVYKTKQAFKSHVEQTHSGLPLKAKPKYICDFCGKSYSQKSGIRVHIHFEHGNGKFFKCEWCKKRFSSFSHLKEHIITHTKDKLFNCKLCGGRFSTKTSLLYHTRIHTGEKPYHCEHCDSSFISASRRMAHVKQHHLPPELQCNICLKEFKLKNCLVKHRLKHFDSKSKLFQPT